ncbi:MAG: hypothetical protein U0787_19935 [Polyangia bacterium]
MLQTYFESSDPTTTASCIFASPPKEWRQSIFQSLGLWDHFRQFLTHCRVRAYHGGHSVEPRLYDLPYLSLTDLRWKNGKVAGNVADGKATAVLKQYVAPPRDDGHFVIFDLWAARHDWSRFLASQAQGGLSVLE